MLVKCSISKYPYNLIILQLLSFNVDAEWTNNYTLIKIINDMRTTWTAGENRMHVPSNLSDSLYDQKTSVPVLRSKLVRTPDTFDAREHWKGCRNIIKFIRTQGRCQSCWAVATVSMLSDRTCISSKGSIRVHLSAEDVITCCNVCNGTLGGNSCQPGYPEDAIYFWIKEGIVTGGEIDSKKGCKPYSRTSFHNGHTQCTRRCTNKRHWKEYGEDKYKGKMVYRVEANEEAIKSEVLKNGPVIAGFLVYEDVRQYRRGVYQRVAGKLEGAHAVRIIGWGEESGVKYWSVANTWGIGWGMKGYMKFIRGANNCKIEQRVMAGRMFDPVSSRETMGKPAVNAGNERSPFFVRNVLWMVYIFICLDTHSFLFPSYRRI